MVEYEMRPYKTEQGTRYKLFRDGVLVGENLVGRAACVRLRMSIDAREAAAAGTATALLGRRS